MDLGDASRDLELLPTIQGSQPPAAAAEPGRWINLRRRTPPDSGTSGQLTSADRAKVTHLHTTAFRRNRMSAVWQAMSVATTRNTLATTAIYALASALAGAGFSVATNAISEHNAYGRAALLVMMASLLMAAFHLKKLSPKAPLVRITAWTLLLFATGAAVVAVIGVESVVPYAVAASTTLAVTAVLLNSKVSAAFETLRVASVTGLGISIVADGIRDLGGGQEVAGASMVGLGVLGIAIVLLDRTDNPIHFRIALLVPGAVGTLLGLIEAVAGNNKLAITLGALGVGLNLIGVVTTSRRIAAADSRSWPGYPAVLWIVAASTGCLVMAIGIAYVYQQELLVGIGTVIESCALLGFGFSALLSYSLLPDCSYVVAGIGLACLALGYVHTYPLAGVAGVVTGVAAFGIGGMPLIRRFRSPLRNFVTWLVREPSTVQGDDVNFEHRG